MQIFLGDTVTLMKGDTIITGKVEGVKLDKGQLEKVAIENIDTWFYMENGWQFLDDTEEEDDEI
jgi:2-keto-4-pentenoate hydratase/2-oxohepta-3-ene-1,7-dioic acid hydratase in catechol pathway